MYLLMLTEELSLLIKIFLSSITLCCNCGITFFVKNLSFAFLGQISFEEHSSSNKGFS